MSDAAKRALDDQVTRRQVLQGATALLIGVCLPLRRSLGQAKVTAAPAFAPNAFVRVGQDDTVTVIVKHVEFGQGPLTGLSTLVAEEMDADWSRVRAEHAPTDAHLYTRGRGHPDGRQGRRRRPKARRLLADQRRRNDRPDDISIRLDPSSSNLDQL